MEKVQECGKLVGGDGQHLWIVRGGLRDAPAVGAAWIPLQGKGRGSGKDSETRQFPGGAGGTLISFLFRNFLVCSPVNL